MARVHYRGSKEISQISSNCVNMIITFAIAAHSIIVASSVSAGCSHMTVAELVVVSTREIVAELVVVTSDIGNANFPVVVCR